MRWPQSIGMGTTLRPKFIPCWCLNPHLDPEEPTFLGLLIMIFLKETLKKGRSSGLQVALAIKANAPETHEVETTLNFTPSCDESFCFEVLGWVRAGMPSGLGGERCI